MRPPTTTDARGTLLVFGAGFIGEHVARRAAEHGYAVLGTTRRRERAKELTKRGVQPLLFRGSEPLADEVVESHLSSVTHILSTVPPSAGADPVLAQHRETLEKRMPSLKWIGHVSTAAVYGAQPHIDASTVPRPGTYGGRLRMLIEREWAALALPPTADPVRIFRPTSVYGPWRGPQQSLRQGMAAAIEKPDHVVSRIHVDDVAAAVLASMEQSLGVFSSDDVQEGGDAATAEADGCPIEGAGCSTYLLADEEPASPAEVLREAAKIYGCPAPEAISYDQIESGLSADARAFWSHPVRAASGGALGALGVRLAYPNYREGLAAVRDVEASPIELPSPPAADEAPVTPPSPPPPKPRRAKAAKAAPKKEATSPPVAEKKTAEAKTEKEIALENEIEALKAQLATTKGARSAAAVVEAATKPAAAGAAASLTDESIETMKVADIKDELRKFDKKLLPELDLRVSGKKDELVDRLKKARDAMGSKGAASRSDDVPF